MRVASVVASVLSALALVLSTAVAASAQQCQLDVRPAEELGYGPRDDRCEGFYVELQSAPTHVRVVSLVRGHRPDSDSLPDSLELRVAPDPLIATTEAVAVLARPTIAGLNWAMDGQAAPRRPFAWDLSVFRRAEIPLESLGFVGVSRRSRDPVYVPLTVGAPGGAAEGDSTHVVLHLPFPVDVARLCDVEAADCVDLSQMQTGGYFDGYWETSLTTAETRGVRAFQVQWRHSSMGDDVGSDRLEILRW